MHVFVVLTDFSAPAENAMSYAGQLARSVGGTICLLHVYQIPVSMNDMPVLMVSAEELKESVDAGLNRSKELLLSQYPDLKVTTESRLGDILEETKDVCAELQPVAVVAGKHGDNAVERFLFGSTSLSLIRHLLFPVLVVPDSVQKRPVKNIAFAVDPGDENIPVDRIRGIADLFRARIHLVHVRPEKTAAPTNSMQLVQQLNGDYTEIQDAEFVHGIETYARHNSIDLLLILPHKHSLVEKLIFRTHTEELMRKLSLPILCIRT